MIDTSKYEEYMELGEERIERTADVWDEMADAFFSPLLDERPHGLLH
jgi:hypothetical protein